MKKTKNSLKNSHVWRKLKRATQKDQSCHFCQKEIPAGAADVWVYDSPYKKVYMCAGEKMGACVFVDNKRKKSKK